MFGDCRHLGNPSDVEGVYFCWKGREVGRSCLFLLIFGINPVFFPGSCQNQGLTNDIPRIRPIAKEYFFVEAQKTCRLRNYK